MKRNFYGRVLVPKVACVSGACAIRTKEQHKLGIIKNIYKVSVGDSGLINEE